MDSRGLEIHEICDGVYHISEPLMVCSTLIVGQEKALLYDTGYGVWDLKHTVETITTLPVIVVNSHGHEDHINGNYQFNDIYIHGKDIELAKACSSPEAKRQILSASAQYEESFPDTFSKEEYMNRPDKISYIPIEEGHIFNLGERVLEVIHIPGHTKGCIALLDRKNKILFGGDSILANVWMFLNESASVPTYLKSLNKVSSLDIDTVIASHTTETIPQKIIEKLILCANNIDISKSLPYSNPLAEEQGLVYTEGEGPDSVSIVYSEDKL